MFLEGYSLNEIARTLNNEDIRGVRNKANWCAVTIDRILKNEKYNGSVLMQKTFTSNYLTKQHLPNTGQLNQYYIEDDHEPIIPKLVWQATQEEIQRRNQFIIDHNLRGLSKNNRSAFYAKVFCEKCDVPLLRIYKNGVKKSYWECNICKKRIDEEVLRSSFVKCYNQVVINRDDYLPKWRKAIIEGTPLQAIRAIQMMKITEQGITHEVKEITQMALKQAAILSDDDLEFVLMTNDSISITD